MKITKITLVPANDPNNFSATVQALEEGQPMSITFTAGSPQLAVNGALGKLFSERFETMKKAIKIVTEVVWG